MLLQRLAKLLLDVRVDRVEVASARVSDGERDAVRMICNFAERSGLLDHIEVLGFVDGCQSVDWIRDCGGKVINLLAKGSRRHCEQQLAGYHQLLMGKKRHTAGLLAITQGAVHNLYGRRYVSVGGQLFFFSHCSIRCWF